MRYINQDGAVDADFAVNLGNLATSLGAPIDDERIRMYAIQLDRYSPEDLVRMFAVAADTCRGGFLPSIGELTGAEDAALIAWAGLDKAAREVGAWSGLDVLDGAAAAALTLVFGSWPAFCEMDDGPALAIKRTEFLAAYRAARRNGKTAPSHLRGRTELDASWERPALRAKVWTAQLTEAGEIIKRRDWPGLPAGPARQELSQGAADG
jgi:hypothetical protein